MRKILVYVFCFFYLLQTDAFSQEINIPEGSNLDTSLAKGSKENRWRVGFYFSPTASFNLGEKIFPFNYDPADCNCYKTFDKIKEQPRVGYKLGFQIQSKKISRKLFINIGLNAEVFHYMGTTTITHYENKYPYTTRSYSSDYVYLDLFLHLPVKMNYQIYLKKNRLLNFNVGISGSTFFRENGNSEYDAFPPHYIKHNWALFGIMGIDILKYTKRKHILQCGPEFNCEINQSPLGRRFASAGIKFGILF
ncbi:MAG: hypothetical protein HY840_04850 [Bacteroidetes bacterium]|nr:hypothetical protein [Bacteroidota bacterium]